MIAAISDIPARATPPRSELYLYRKHVLTLLRRFFHASIEVGRLPSLLGGEVFRARVTSYRIQSFEDLVIFAHDIERCLNSLDDLSQQIIARMVFQGYTLEETGRLLHRAEITIRRRFPATLDRLAERFLARGILLPLAMHDPSLSSPHNLECDANLLELI